MMPFDLVIANILAGPLIDMAADITGLLASDGRLVLAGLLQTQADDVVTYGANGLKLTDRINRGDWAICRWWSLKRPSPQPFGDRIVLRTMGDDIIARDNLCNLDVRQRFQAAVKRGEIGFRLCFEAVPQNSGSRSNSADNRQCDIRCASRVR